jgi:hypothetical protein
MTQRDPYLIIAGPGRAELLGGCYAFEFAAARRCATALGGMVTSSGWYRRHFGVDPLPRLKPLDEPRQDGRGRWPRLRGEQP